MRPTAPQGLAGLVFCALAAPSPAQTVVFDELHRSLPVAHDFTVSLAVADLDGDGTPDVFAGNRDEQDRLYVGDGEGRLLDATQGLPVDSFQTRDAAAADVDLDGDLDLFLGTSFSPNRLYLNAGAAVFADASGQVPAFVDTTIAVALGDVDGDGDPDALTFNTANLESDHLLLNDGGGVFADAPFLFGQSAILDAVLVDVDGDADLDLVGTGKLYLGDGAAGFADASAQIVPPPAGAFGLAVADVNGDGNDDLALAVHDDPNRLYLGDGAGGFAEAAGALPLDADASFRVAAADVDGDGDADLAFANSSGQQNRLYAGDGTGAFADVTAAQFPLRPDSSRDVALFDADGDGDPDAYFANEVFEQNRLYRNDGQGSFADVTKHPAFGVFEIPGPTSDFAVGDVDGDGDGDLLEANGPTADARLLLNDGTGAYADGSAQLPPPSGVAAADAELGDLDGDGDLDAILVGGATGLFLPTQALLLGDGLGTFTDATGNLPPTLLQSSSAALGDVDGDGDLDLLVGRVGTGFSGPAGEANALFLNGGAGTFSDASGQLPAHLDATADVALADFTGDGAPDALIGNGPVCPPPFCGFPVGSQNRLYEGDGLGGFLDVTGRLPAVADKTVALAVADVDGNGLLDVVAANAELEQNRLLLGIGGGQFNDATALLPPALDWTLDAAVGDVDGDGNPDVVFANLPSTFLVYAGGPGASAFTDVTASLTAQPPDDELRSVALTDADGDGDLDLLVGADQENRLYANLSRHVAVRAVPAVGRPETVDLYGQPAGPWGLFAAPAAVSQPLPPFGTLMLDPGGLLFLDAGTLDGAGRDSRTFAIAANPNLVGATVHLQAVINLPLALTNREAVTVTGL